LVSVRTELRLGDANSEYELRRVTTANSDELHYESEGGVRRESELGQREGEGSTSIYMQGRGEMRASLRRNDRY
jgi:hypothetical protein